MSRFLLSAALMLTAFATSAPSAHAQTFRGNGYGRGMYSHGCGSSSPSTYSNYSSRSYDPYYNSWSNSYPQTRAGYSNTWGNSGYNHMHSHNRTRNSYYGY